MLQRVSSIKNALKNIKSANPLDFIDFPMTASILSR